MSETEFRIFNQIFSIGADLAYGILLVLFLRPFLAENRRRRNQFLIFALDLSVRLLCAYMPVPQGFSGLLLAMLLTVFSGIFGLERKTAFLLAVFCWNASTSSILMVESLYFLAEQMTPILLDPLKAIYLRAAVLIMAFLLSHIALMAAMLYALQRQIRKRRIALHRRELCYLSLMPATGILFGQIISRLWLEFKDGILIHLYERHPAFLAVIPLLALLFFAGSYLTIAFQQGMDALREEQTTHYIERQQTQAIRARLHEVEQFYTHIRQVKHEMRGHLTNIKGLARNGEYAALEDYIAQLDTSMSGLELTFQTGNPVTDVIVNDIQQQCKELGIRFQMDFHYPEPEVYDAFDVGIILQNLLQNAIDACEKVPEEERFVELTGKRKGRFYLIEVKNAFSGDVIWGQNGLPITTKEEGSLMHGIGLSNVRREAEKYMGELELWTRQHEFSAAVLLQERSSI